jgi:hypothetical protein
VIFQIDFAREKSEREQHHARVKRESNRQSSENEQQKINRDVRCDRIFLLEKKFFFVFKHRDHVSRNEQLHNTKIAEQTIIFTEIECNNLLAHSASTQRQRSSNDQQSRSQ